MKEYYVYVLRCSDGTLYTGVTSDYEERVAQHHSGVFPGCYTYKRRPVELVHLETFQTTDDAISREKQIKRWSRRRKKDLIEGKYEQLSEHAKKIFLHIKTSPFDTPPRHPECPESERQ